MMMMMMIMNDDDDEPVPMAQHGARWTWYVTGTALGSLPRSRQ